MPRDENLLKYATPRQAAYLETVWSAGSISAAAEIMGINRGTVGRGIREVEQKAAADGYAPAPAGAGRTACRALERVRLRNERWERASTRNSDIKRRARNEPIEQIAACHGLSATFVQRIAGAFGG
ncbi:hypothetical protein [Sphingopyxis sp.]|uniref:hypothetical protein n=1 Tax=Sphingopyxis sp. TaxID=1908224 RepID=UPI004036239B